MLVLLSASFWYCFMTVLAVDINKGMRRRSFHDSIFGFLSKH